MSDLCRFKTSSAGTFCMTHTSYGASVCADRVTVLGQQLKESYHALTVIGDRKDALEAQLAQVTERKKHYQHRLGEEVARSVDERMKDADSQLAAIALHQKMKIATLTTQVRRLRELLRRKLYGCNHPGSHDLHCPICIEARRAIEGFAALTGGTDG